MFGKMFSRMKYFKYNIISMLLGNAYKGQSKPIVRNLVAFLTIFVTDSYDIINFASKTFSLSNAITVATKNFIFNIKMTIMLPIHKSELLWV